MPFKVIFKGTFVRLTESLIPGDGNRISVTKTIRAIEQS